MKRVLENKKIKPRKLPPIGDSLRLLVLRCCYQLMIWKRALTSLVDLPSPTEYGCIIDAYTGLYMPQMVGQPLAPPELLKNLVCCCEDQYSDVCVQQMNNHALKHVAVHKQNTTVEMCFQYYLALHQNILLIKQCD